MTKKSKGRHAAATSTTLRNLGSLGLLCAVTLCFVLVISQSLGSVFASKGDAENGTDENEQLSAKQPIDNKEAPTFTAFGEPEDEGSVANLFTQNKSSIYVSLDVPTVLQYPELPTGCESLALTNSLLYLGFDLEKTTIADDWLELSETDFVNAFLGNPRDPGGNSCMAPALTKAANSFLMSQNSSLRAINVSGISFDEVLSLVAEGKPVIVWDTMDLLDPGLPYLSQAEDGLEYYLYETSHTVVVSGYDLENGLVFISDSLIGSVEYDKEAFADSYQHVGSQAIVIS